MTSQDSQHQQLFRVALQRKRGTGVTEVGTHRSKVSAAVRQGRYSFHFSILGSRIFGFQSFCWFSELMPWLLCFNTPLGSRCISQTGDNAAEKVDFNLSCRLWPELATADRWLRVLLTIRLLLLVFSHSDKQKRFNLKIRNLTIISIHIWDSHFKSSISPSRCMLKHGG